MTVNYWMKCPVCQKVTRLRSPAGYVYRTPVRIHCGNCGTLMTGYFISDNKKIRAFYEPENASEVRRDADNLEADYYGEVSAEVLTHKVCDFTEMESAQFPCQSPAMISLRKIDIDDNEAFINYICYLEDTCSNWSVIKPEYDLFINRKYDFIKDRCKNEAAKKGYVLTSEFQIQRFFAWKFFYEVAGLWKPGEISSALRSVNYEFQHLNKLEIQRILEVVPPEKLQDMQNKLFGILFNYIRISLYLAPALSTFYYKDVDDIDYEKYGLSTCSFEDIKGFYQDTFEDLCRYCYIIKMLDNIKYRGKYDVTNGCMDLTEFQNSSNGAKIKNLPSDEFFSKTFGVNPDMNVLRNGIGHNNYTYDGIGQMLDFVPNPKKPDVHQKLYLLEIAQRCLKLMQSTAILEFYIHELLREHYRAKEENMSFPKWMYNGVSSQSHCPCGSGKKYGKCCKKVIKPQPQNIWDYPHKACMRMEMSHFPKQNVFGF